MKFSPLTTSLQTGEITGIDLLPIERFVPTNVKSYTQHYIFSRNIGGILYTFLIKIFVNNPHCETEVTATKFNTELGHDSSYRTYGGEKRLQWSIDTEQDIIYYLQDLAAMALNNYIVTSMKGLYS